MSDSLFVNWAALSLSVFNVIVLLWLGLTVILNSDRRTWGIWVAGSSLVLGAIFFINHTIILQHGLDYNQWQFAMWWAISFFPAHFLPYLWYVVMLWYAGYWENSWWGFNNRHFYGFILVTAAMMTGAFLLVGGSVLSTLNQEASLQRDVTSTYYQFRGVLPYPQITMPLLAAGFTTYMVLCMALSLDAIYRPGPSVRLMGDLARQRARPWLLAATVSLLLVTGVTGLVMYWAWANIRLQGNRFYQFYDRTYNLLAQIDLWVLVLISLAVITLGQAAVAYELFTGHTLPRDGLRYYWRNVVIMGFALSVLGSSMIIFDVPALHGLLLVAVFVTYFSALISRRSYIEREQIMRSLRPFVTGQKLYENLLTQTAIDAYGDAQKTFSALCENVLNAQEAYLLAVGPLASLVNRPLTHPAGQNPPPLHDLVEQLEEERRAFIPLQLPTYPSLIWAIPLRSERGIIGVLFIGAKFLNGLYTTEEMEIARAGAERLLDIQASMEIAQRLMALQRQKLIQSQLLDQQTRRVLHDEVLPQIHTAMLTLGGSAGEPETVQLLMQAHKQISDLLRAMPQTAVHEVERLGVVGALKKAVGQEMLNVFSEVKWHIPEIIEPISQKLPPITAEILFYAAREAVRNSAKHSRGGQNNRPVTLTISAACPNQTFQLMVEDNGVGLNGQKSSKTSGTSQGLALHSTMLAVVGGEMAMESQPNEFTRVTLTVPFG